MRGRVSEIVIPAGLVLLVLALFFGVIMPPTLHDVPESGFTSYDFHSYFLPRFILGSEELSRGHWPLWNAYEYAGVPFLATAQPTALYPPKILIFGLFPVGIAYWVFLIAHYLASGWGFLQFVREQKLSTVAVFAGTALWVFSIGTLTSNYHLNRLPNFCWIPYFFLFAHRLAAHAKVRDFAYLALVVGLQLTSGYPEVVVDTAILVGVTLLVRPWSRAASQPLWLALALLVGAVALGVVIASAQLLPLVEIAGEVRRTAMAEQTTGELRNWYQLDRVFWPPALAGLMLLTFARRSGLMAATDTLLCLFIVGGGWMLLRRIPGFSFVRFPLAWAMIAQFPFAWCGAVGTDTLLSAASDTPARRRIVAGLALVAGIFGFLYSGARALGLRKSSGVLEVVTNTPSAILGIVGSALVVAAAVFVFRGRSGDKWMLAGALVLVLSHVSSYPFGYVPAAIERPTPQGKVATLLGTRALKGRALSTYDVLYGYNLTDRIPSIFGAEQSFLPWRYREIILRVRFLAIFRFVDWHALMTARGLLDALNLEYAVAAPTERERFLANGFFPVREAGPDVLYENRDRMGTAWVNYTARVLSSEKAVRDHVLSRHFDPHVEVVLEKPARHRYATRAEHLATGIRSERRPSATELELELELPRPGILVTSETAFPGWRVEVDGKPAEWMRADYVLRGVELDAGPHRVRFFYRSKAFEWGLWLSACGIIAAGALWILSFRHKPVRWLSS